MNIGLVVAMPEEILPFLEKAGKPAENISSPGFDVKLYEIGRNRVYVANSGVGEISAAATVQHLISAFNVEKIINFGVVGGLKDAMKLKSICVVEKAVHYDYDISPFVDCKKAQYQGFPDVYIEADSLLVSEAMSVYPNLYKATCASADKFVDSPVEKKRLATEFDADICDMESAGILLTALRNHVPALLIKAVSDSVSGGAEEFNRMVTEAAGVCCDIIIHILSK